MRVGRTGERSDGQGILEESGVDHRDSRRPYPWREEGSASSVAGGTAEGDTEVEGLHARSESKKPEWNL